MRHLGGGGGQAGEYLSSHISCQRIPVESPIQLRLLALQHQGVAVVVAGLRGGEEEERGTSRVSGEGGRAEEGWRGTSRVRGEGGAQMRGGG